MLFLLDTPLKNRSIIRHKDYSQVIYKNNSLDPLKLPFLENRGRLDDAVRFYTQTHNGLVFITTKGEIVYSFSDFQKSENQESHLKEYSIKENFVGATPNPIGINKNETRVSPYKGKNPNNWKKNLPSFSHVYFPEIYHGIDVRLKIHSNSMEKLFYLKPHSNLECLRSKIESADRLFVNNQGELEIQTKLRGIKFTKPVAYQHGDEGLEPVEIAYAVNGNEYGFSVGRYDHNRELVIDPLLASTYLGGSFYNLIAGEFSDVRKMLVVK
jgi:hypothetical protein